MFVTRFKDTIIVVMDRCEYSLVKNAADHGAIDVQTIASMGGLTRQEKQLFESARWQRLGGPLALDSESDGYD